MCTNCQSVLKEFFPLSSGFTPQAPCDLTSVSTHRVAMELPGDGKLKRAKTENVQVDQCPGKSDWILFDFLWIGQN